ncbi:MAG: hypothetical protein B7X31_15530 [Thiomonas sp. 13-66-29]|nr:MAG: hypothetical protein B7X31_15530 [Thiomonas sp. 13-66-29]
MNRRSATRHLQCWVPSATGPAWTLIVAYGLIGFGYVIPATFLPVIAGERLHLPALREWFWPLYGAATIALTLLLPRILRSVDNRRALAAACASMGAGIALCLIWPSIVGLILATILIGSVTMPIVMVVMREARALAPHDPTRLIAWASSPAINTEVRLPPPSVVSGALSPKLCCSHFDAAWIRHAETVRRT